MKLLFDQNLSTRLKSLLDDIYPESIHVREIGLQSSDDYEVWTYAAHNQFTIATKDSDFRQLSFLFGHPPKVVWIRLGNCTTNEIESILRRHYDEVMRFDRDEENSFLALS